MPTVDSKELVDEIIAGDGYFEDDPRCVKIVQYTNSYGPRPSYGLIYDGDDLFKYCASYYVRNPITIWEAKPKPRRRYEGPKLTIGAVLNFKKERKDEK
jgi:hypothetical protein